MEKYFGAEWLLHFTTTVAAAVFFLFFSFLEFVRKLAII